MSDSIPVMKPWFDDAEVEAAGAAIRSGWVAQGPRVAEFEQLLAAHVGSAAGVAVSSCTTGLHLVLHALGMGPADEVIVPSLSFIATANAPRYVGATPVFADVDRSTQNITVDSIDAVATERTRAIIAVHQVGMPCDLDAIRSYCEARDLILVEDAACAIGSTYKGRSIGADPGLNVFSFHPRKLLTTGEGGMITTDDTEFAERLRSLRQHSMSASAFDRHTSSNVQVERYRELGFNFRMTDVQAAIGIAQLAKIDRMVDRRRFLAKQYQAALGGVPGVVLPADPDYGTTNYQSFSVILTEDYATGRSDLMDALQHEGISSRRGVMAAHREPAFDGLPHAPLPNTDYVTERSIILPLFHGMTPEQVDRVSEIVASHAAA